MRRGVGKVFPMTYWGRRTWVNLFPPLESEPAAGCGVEIVTNERTPFEGVPKGVRGGEPIGGR